MKPFDWNLEKNNWLRSVRRVTFEEIIFHIQAGDLLDVIQIGKSGKYPNQRIFVINIEGYVYLVPFVESEEAIFLKTVIPSRKMTKRYLGGAREHETD
ncbi:MAG TPA: toxin [Candidatus Hydrogenedentes bacterium]|nr:toxin [Candidatus Hydrogenedentota bacterium]